MFERTCHVAFFGLAVLAGGCTAISGRARHQPPELEAFRSRLAADCAAGAFSGIVAVERQGRTLLLEACGVADIAGSAAVRMQDRFKLFSISKVFTATAVLRLVERGRMQLDAPLSDYVRDVPAQWRAVTIRHLLQHRSGISDHTERLLDAYRTAGHRTHDAAMRHVLSSLRETAELASPPGATWRYSNFGYELLALAAARSQNRPFHEIVQEQVFAPAGMRDAVMSLPARDISRLEGLPISRLVAGFNGEPGRLETAVSYSFVQQGAGAVAATYWDLLSFSRSLQHGRVLSPAMLEAIEHDSAPINDRARYGLGWMIRTVETCTYWYHSGGTNGYVSDFAVAPRDGITIVILSNLGFAEPSAYRSDLMTALLGQEECARSQPLD